MTLQDRIQIEIGVATNESLRAIGSRLLPPRPASTIKREIDNNGRHTVDHPDRNSGYRRKHAFGARQSTAAPRGATAR
uniref:helix-turn-helix domain-containing protein n=1 Tax=Mycolicibacterium gadium TaxID=1794 RepID=UPI001F41D978|nr:helix-turn-helix domain-containing protein [Mycolicibacterium gadium]